MVDVVVPDVAREPLQDPGQFVEGTALQRRRGVIPLVAALPINSFELMLHIKQPVPGRAGHGQRCQLQQQVRLEAENPTHHRAHPNQRQVRPDHRLPFPRPRHGGRDPLLDEKHIKRGEAEKDDRVARQAIGKAPPARCFQIFLDGQRPYISGAAPVQIARSGVVNGVLPAPMPERRERQHTRDEADNIVRLPGRKKGAVSAIVEDDE